MAIDSTIFVPPQVKRKLDTSSPGSAKDKTKLKTLEPPPKKPRQGGQVNVAKSTVQKPGSVYDEEIICGLELLLSDYAYGDQESAQWLRERERTIDGDNGYIHLSSLLEHELFKSIKPAVTQKTLQRALLSQSPCSGMLQLSPHEYHVRRRLRSKVTAQKRSTDWDIQTIYVEPHLSTLCANPPRLIHHVLQHSTLPESFKPIQHVRSRHQAWAFITLSAPVTEDLVLQKDIWPPGWIVLTKHEHARRDAEYASLIPLHRFRPYHYHHQQQQALPPPPPQTQRLTSSLPPPSHEPAPPPTGHLIHLSNLPIPTNKFSIQALISQTVDAYFSSQLTTSSSTTNLKIAYIDYVPSSTMTTTAIMRCCSAEDAKKVVVALEHLQHHHPHQKKQKKKIKGGKQEEELVVVGDMLKARLMCGEEERLYWEEVRREQRKDGLLRRRKDRKKKRGEERNGGDGMVQMDVVNLPY